MDFKLIPPDRVESSSMEDRLTYCQEVFNQLSWHVGEDALVEFLHRCIYVCIPRIYTQPQLFEE